MARTADTPKYTHDCDCCTFLGHVAGQDLYWCPQGGMATIIARDGSEGPNYQSMPVHLMAIFPDQMQGGLRAGYNLAKANGLA